MVRSITTLWIVAALVHGNPAEAASVELIANGGFEAGEFGPWEIVDLPNGKGSWFLRSQHSGPASFLPTVGPANGEFYALADQDGPGSHVLYQDFSVPVNSAELSLSFSMFRKDTSGLAPINAGNLEFAGEANQHARVDIVRTTADPFSVVEGDIVVALVAPGGEGDDFFATPPYISYSFTLTGLLSPGGNYRLRFAEVDNQLNFQNGVDDVSLIANVSAVPVPAAAWLCVPALGLLGSFCRRRGQTNSLFR